jgi:hypothetical protein
MEQQRCVWHGKRDFFYPLFQEGLKKKAQGPYRQLIENNPLFFLRKQQLEQLGREDRPVVEKLVRMIKRSFKELLASLPSDKYPKARTYVANFYRHALLFFDYWLKGKGWLPLNTNLIEAAFSRLVNRIKHIARRWSERGLINWLRLAFRKIFYPELWRKLWNQYLRLSKILKLISLKVEYRWVLNATT